MIPPRLSRQAGQALPLAMVLLVAVAATVFFMFNSGQLVQEKIRLTNTADAVAYSAGVFEARVLNYDAYANRAIIANEIAIGQAVALASWAKYAGTAADNISPYMYLIPYAGAAIASVLEKVRDAMDMYTPALAYSVSMHDAAMNALAASQLAVHGPGNVVATSSRMALMDAVAKKNDPDAKVDWSPVSDDFAEFTRLYSSQDERKRMGRVVDTSRDAFLKSRNWDFDDLVFNVLGCKVGPALRKRGSTELVDLTEGWKSMDTLSFHSYWLKIKWSGISCRHSETPLGYGTAFSDADMDDSAYGYAGSRPTNPRASGRADSSEGIAEGFDPEPSTVGGGAIPDFHDLSESALTQEEPRTSLAIRVTKESGKQRFSGGNSIIKPKGSLDLYQGAPAKNVSAAIARVEVFFERPDGKNPIHAKEEVGSLFNPYWQARLVPVTAAERALAQFTQELSLP
jgi:hypothetical protein